MQQSYFIIIIVTVFCVSFNLYRVSSFLFYTTLYRRPRLHFMTFILKKILHKKETIYNNKNKELYKKDIW